MSEVVYHVSFLNSLSLLTHHSYPKPEFEKNT